MMGDKKDGGKMVYNLVYMLRKTLILCTMFAQHRGWTTDITLVWHDFRFLQVSSLFYLALASPTALLPRS